MITTLVSIPLRGKGCESFNQRFEQDFLTDPQKFQSPCGERVVKAETEHLKITQVVLKFQSPCGERVVKEAPPTTLLRKVEKLFQSPCGERVVKVDFF